MAFFWRIYNPDTGALMYDITDRISRILVEFDIPTNINSGTVTLPAYNGALFYNVFNDEMLIASIANQRYVSSVSFSLSGSTLTWTRIVRAGTPEFPIRVQVGSY